MSSKLPRIPGINSEKELQVYFNEIKQLLMEHGNLDESKAERLIDESGIFADLVTENDLLYLFHEEPYYWAMEILHAPINPEWYQDPNLWPPPRE
ncbi:MAG: hypothetical protein IT327_09880 [Anaerolineae bacterium]|nr:hypothetical protein [Anaerolineae bacterium]